MSLRARVALRRGRLDLDVCLDVADSQTVAIVGPNGAGKTTLLRVLAGLTALQSGLVEVDGVTWEDSATRTRLAAHRRSVGMVFQDVRLLPHLAVVDNVGFGLRCAGAGRASARDQATAWLVRVGMERRAADRPAGLSGGEAQRVALARALATRPRLLLLDEPTASADAGARLQLRALVREELGGYPGTRVVVTHDADEAAELASRVIRLDRGAVVEDSAGGGS